MWASPRARERSGFYRGNRIWEGYCKQRFQGFSLSPCQEERDLSSFCWALLPSLGMKASPFCLLTLFNWGFCLLVFYACLFACLIYFCWKLDILIRVVATLGTGPPPSLPPRPVVTPLFVYDWLAYFNEATLLTHRLLPTLPMKKLRSNPRSQDLGRCHISFFFFFWHATFHLVFYHFLSVLFLSLQVSLPTKSMNAVLRKVTVYRWDQAWGSKNGCPLFSR